MAEVRLGARAETQGPQRRPGEAEPHRAGGRGVALCVPSSQARSLGVPIGLDRGAFLAFLPIPSMDFVVSVMPAVRHHFEPQSHDLTLTGLEG